MTAKEMFKELEMEKIIHNNIYYIEYSNLEIRIGFNAHFKDIKIDDGIDCVYFDIPTLKAIIKQCEELGWVE